MNAKSLAFGFVLGILGYALGRLIPESQPNDHKQLDQVSEPALANVEHETKVELERLEDPQHAEKREVAAAGVHQQSSFTGDAFFSQALLAHFDKEYQRAWSTEREQAPLASQVDASEQAFRDKVIALPGLLGKNAAIALNESEATADAILHGDGLLILSACAQRDFVLSSSDFTPGLFQRALAPRVSNATLKGEELSSASKGQFEDGVTLEFGAGLHSLKDAWIRREDGEFPEDLHIVGAGINTTLLKIDEFAARGAVQRLHVRDITLDAGNDYLFDLRGGGLTIDMENVRVVRFDMGAGSSLVFGVRNGVLIRARNCEFLDGYGRHPGSGNLFRGSALVASFTGCLFRTVELRLSRGNESSVLFNGCTFENYRNDPTLSTWATFDDCVVRSPRSSHNSDNEPRSLTEFFPGWTER